MEQEFRQYFNSGRPGDEVSIRIRRIDDKDSIVYQFNQVGEESFRMIQNRYGQWEFEDRLHAPMNAVHLESELIRVIRENEG